MIIAAAVLATACASSGLPTAFPAEAQPIKADTLKERLNGRTYTGRLANGVGWEMTYAADGRFNMRTGNGDTDWGRWRTEDNRLCVDFEGKVRSGCSDVRANEKSIFLKRNSTGDVVSLKVTGSHQRVHTRGV